MGCEFSYEDPEVRYLRPITYVYQPKTQTRFQPKHIERVETKVSMRTDQPAMDMIDTSLYSYSNIDTLIRQIEQEFASNSLTWQVREKCRLVLYLLEIEKKSIRNDEQYTNLRKRRMTEAVAALNPPLMAQIKSTNRALPDVYKITFDAICILLRLYVRPVNIIPMRISQKMVVEFWQDSFNESGQDLVGPMFDFRGDLIRLSEGEGINAETLELLQPLVTQEWFNEETVSRASKAIGILVLWVKNLWEFAGPNKIISRRRAQLTRLQRWVECWMRKNAVDVYNEKSYR